MQPSAPVPKNILQGQLADLRLHVRGARTLGLALLRRSEEHRAGGFEQLRLPLHDLTRRTSNLSDSSASVLSPLSAANATFAL